MVRGRRRDSSGLDKIQLRDVISFKYLTMLSTDRCADYTRMHCIASIDRFSEELIWMGYTRRMGIRGSIQELDQRDWENPGKSQNSVSPGRNLNLLPPGQVAAVPTALLPSSVSGWSSTFHESPQSVHLITIVATDSQSAGLGQTTIVYSYMRLMDM
jgi:hypothetical protein